MVKMLKDDQKWDDRVIQKRLNSLCKHVRVLQELENNEEARARQAERGILVMLQRRRDRTCLELTETLKVTLWLSSGHSFLSSCSRPA
jgi:hypothetical protein